MQLQRNRSFVLATPVPYAQHGAEREEARRFKLLQDAAAVAIWQLLLQHCAADSRCCAT
jgi:hypothetical protein